GAQVPEHVMGVGEEHVRVGDRGDAVDQVEKAEDHQHHRREKDQAPALYWPAGASGGPGCRRCHCALLCRCGWALAQPASCTSIRPRTGRNGIALMRGNETGCSRVEEGPGLAREVPHCCGGASLGLPRGTVDGSGQITEVEWAGPGGTSR